MKQFLPFLFLLSLAPISHLSAQENSDWQPVYLQVTGHNETDGVYAWFKLGECDSEEVVFIKLENKNPFAVDVNFYDAVFKKDLKWYERKESRRTIRLEAGETTSGDCTNTPYVVDLSHFVSNSFEFKRYSTYQFSVKPIN